MEGSWETTSADAGTWKVQWKKRKKAPVYKSSWCPACLFVQELQAGTELHGKQHGGL